MSSANYQIIRNAILNKQNVSADYKDFFRIMTPHVLGHKNGKEKCLLYQFDGKSSSATTFPENSPKNWRCVFLDELRNIAVIDGTMHTCDQHRQRQTCVDDVDVELEI